MLPVTMFRFASALAFLAASARMALGSAARGVRHRLAATFGDWRRSERERFLAASADHFDIERRERAWDWQSRNGSLLGW